MYLPVDQLLVDLPLQLCERGRVLAHKMKNEVGWTRRRAVCQLGCDGTFAGG
jgi:hypothetical protein